MGVVVSYEDVCAAMVRAMDPELRLSGAELESMAIRVARRFSTDIEEARSTVLKMDRVAQVLYAESGKPYAPTPEARWRWFFEQVDA
jgi:hypothetical protein